MKKFIAILTIVMVAILTTSCGASRYATQEHLEIAKGRSNTSEFAAEMQARGNASAQIALSNNQDVQVENKSITVQETTGNTTREKNKQTITYTITSNIHIEGIEYDSKDMKARDRNGRKYGKTVTARVDSGSVYNNDNIDYNPDNH